MSARRSDPAACPCGSGASFARCCGPWHDGAPAPSAEALMRSRYSAYVLGRDDYLRATWHPSTRPAVVDLDPALRWLGLEVRAAPPPVQVPAADDTAAERATVEFVARFRVAGRGHRLHELSRFVREDGRWWYVDGDTPPSASGR